MRPLFVRCFSPTLERISMCTKTLSPQASRPRSHKHKATLLPVASLALIRVGLGSETQSEAASGGTSSTPSKLTDNCLLLLRPTAVRAMSKSGFSPAAAAAIFS